MLENFSATSYCQNNICLQSPGHSGEQRVFNLDPFVSDEVDAIHSSMGLPEVQLASNRLETVRV